MNETLARIDKAIERLKAVNPQTKTVKQSIVNLAQKRVWVESGNYALGQINQEAVSIIGRMICANVKLWQRLKT